MALTQVEINKATVTAVFIIKSKTEEELRKIVKETVTEEQQAVAAQSLKAQMCKILKRSADSIPDEYMLEVVKRVRSNAEYRLLIGKFG